MESIIKKAIEGGYKYSCAPTQFQPIGDGMTCNFTGVNSQWACWNRDDNDSTICVSHSETILDPIFWQSIGKACGWGEKDNSRTAFWTRQTEGNTITLLDEWENVALTFNYLNLTEGWDKAIDYLSELIK